MGKVRRIYTWSLLTFWSVALVYQFHLIRMPFSRVPTWTLGLPAFAIGHRAVVLAVDARRWRRAAEVVALGLCPSCRYDLRASPGRCPECGADRRP